MKTIEYWMDGAGAEQRHAQSALMAQHCRAGSFERRFAILMNDNLRVTEDLETYVLFLFSSLYSCFTDMDGPQVCVQHAADGFRGGGIRVPGVAPKVGWAGEAICACLGALRHKRILTALRIDGRCVGVATKRLLACDIVGYC
jgi:hypothetical protein